MRGSHWYVLFALLTLACQRKAPGPDECRAFAYRAVGVTRAEQLRRADVRESVNELTQSCLTTPFDRELLQCVQLTGRLRSCKLSFDARRNAGNSRDQF
jgi:hypothetical protein